MGYEEACRENGIPLRESYIYSGDCTIESGVLGLETLVRNNPEMTAVVVGNYHMSVGVMIGMNCLLYTSGIRFQTSCGFIDFKM